MQSSRASPWKYLLHVAEDIHLKFGDLDKCDGDILMLVVILLFIQTLLMILSFAASLN